MDILAVVPEQEASVGDVIAAVGMTLLGTFWVAKVLPGLWTADKPNRVTRMFRYDPVPAMWPWGAPLWHAYARGIPFLGAATSTWGPLLLLDYFAPALLRESFLFGAMLVVSVVGALLGSASIALLNQPRLLVPRPLRDKPGLLVEAWKRGRTRWQARRRRRPTTPAT